MRTIVAVPDQALSHNLMTALAEFPEIEVVRQIALYPEPDDFLRIIRARKPDFVFLSVEDFPKFQVLAAAIDDRIRRDRRHQPDTAAPVLHTDIGDGIEFRLKAIAEPLEPLFR